jgi:hypothetical protein
MTTPFERDTVIKIVAATIEQLQKTAQVRNCGLLHDDEVSDATIAVIADSIFDDMQHNTGNWAT